MFSMFYCEYNMSLGDFYKAFTVIFFGIAVVIPVKKDT